MMSSLPRTKSPLRTTFLREEKEDDAIYDLSLKKVRYRSSCSDNNEEPVSHLQWETILIKKIKAGTLAKLVDNLVPRKDSSLEDMDPGFLMAFLSTYRAFAEVENVLELLLERCLSAKLNRKVKLEESDRIIKSIVGVMTVWLEQFSSDFNKPPNYTNLKRLNKFMQEGMNDEDCTKDLSKKIKEKLQTFIITPYESEGDPMSFRLSMLKDLDYTVEVDGKSGLYDELDFDFLSIKATCFAEQLTLMDAELFRKVIPWHCLGSVWSNRRRKHKNNTVKNTVDQFNSVSLRVVSTILMCNVKKGSASKRAKHIIHWIEIAKECRELKNFSSLKAIISGLQSASIHRLKKTWMHVPRDWQLLYAELASIFSEDKNQQMSRDLLMKEGTAKRSENELPGLKRLNSLKKRRSRFFNTGSVMQGTVPYLGTFLTDLMMVDAAHPDYLEDGLINFNKRRKEFEIIAQIKLLQEAAKNYTIVPDEKFRHSFDTLMTFSEADCFNLSCELEKESIKKRHPKVTLRRNRSEPDIASLDIDNSLSPKRCTLPRQESRSTENSPILPRHQRNNSSDSASSSSSSSSKEISILKRSSSPCSRTLASRASSPPAIWVSSPARNSTHSESNRGHIIRVSLEDHHDSGLLYKGLWLGQDERTLSFIQKCLQKHGVNDKASDYNLVQQLHNDNELVFPDNCNVYYAMKSKEEPLTFRLRKKKNI